MSELGAPGYGDSGESRQLEWGATGSGRSGGFELVGDTLLFTIGRSNASQMI